MAITAMPWSLNPIGRRHCGHHSHVFFHTWVGEEKNVVFFKFGFFANMARQ